jgi:hypothetical protein
VIETFLSPRLRQSSSRHQPVVLATACASLDCGCAAYVGRMPENGREVTVLEPCSAGHETLIGRARRALVDEMRVRRPGEHPVRAAERALREAAG